MIGCKFYFLNFIERRIEIKNLYVVKILVLEVLVELIKFGS